MEFMARLFAKVACSNISAFKALIAVVKDFVIPVFEKGTNFFFRGFIDFNLLKNIEE